VAQHRGFVEGAVGELPAAAALLDAAIRLDLGFLGPLGHLRRVGLADRARGLAALGAVEGERCVEADRFRLRVHGHDPAFQQADEVAFRIRASPDIGAADADGHRAGADVDRPVAAVFVEVFGGQAEGAAGDVDGGAEMAAAGLGRLLHGIEGITSLFADLDRAAVGEPDQDARAFAGQHPVTVPEFGTGGQGLPLAVALEPDRALQGIHPRRRGGVYGRRVSQSKNHCCQHSHPLHRILPRSEKV